MRFEVYRSGIIFREWRFRIVAANHRVLSHSEGYQNKGDAIHAAELIQQEAGDAPIEVRDT